VVFESFTKSDSDLYVEFGMGTKHAMQGFGTVQFWCYPRYLGITRRSCLEAHMVLDMEYRERD
jgi:hypothetical protein